MKKEYIVYNENDNFPILENLSIQNKEPSSYNRLVRIKKYKIIVEKISEPVNIYKERLKDLYSKEDNYHNKEALNEYSQKLFGVNILNLDKQLTEEEKLEAVKTIIENAGLEKIDLSHLDWKFKNIEFKYDKSENFYNYIADYRLVSVYYTPIKNNCILTFKTLVGAKRNFIKKFLTKN